MFDIEYKGGNTVVITTKKTTLIADPKLSVVGLKDVSIDGAIEIATEAQFAGQNNKAKLAIEGPGEYEVGDFSIRGVRAQRHIDTPTDEPISTMYRIEVGDARIALLGNIADKLQEDQLEQLGVIDILILPVGGGGYTLDATGAATLVRQIEPKVIMPIHYADQALSYEVQQDTLDVFVKELGLAVETLPKYKFKSAASLPEVVTIVEITRS